MCKLDNNLKWRSPLHGQQLPHEGDEGGQAGTHAITVSASGSDTIIGETSFLINGNYDSVTFYTRERFIAAI